MTHFITQVRNMDGKPDERILLRALAEKYGAAFDYNSSTGMVTLRGDTDSVMKARNEYSRIIRIMYSRAAFLQGAYSWENKHRTMYITAFVNEVVHRIKDGESTYYGAVAPRMEQTYKAQEDALRLKFND